MSNVKKPAETFGSGSFIGDIMGDPDFFDRPIHEQASQIGWADGCPVVLELTDPGNTSPGRGPEAMRSRYAEINMWFGFIARQVEDMNPDLYNLLMSKVPRRPGEPVGKHESQSVPEDYAEVMYPMNTIAGFALPRVFVEFISSGTEAESVDARQDRMVKGLTLLDEAIQSSKEPEQLLTEFTDLVLAQPGTPVAPVVKHVLGRGWFEEHNGTSAIQDVKSLFEKQDGPTWSYYKSLSDGDKQKIRLM